MTEDARKHLKKADAAVHSAELCLAGGEAASAAGRAYYALFYAAKALLAEDGLETSRHSGVHHLLWKHFVKPGRLDPKYYQWIVAAFESRLQSDYDVDAVFTEDDAAETLQHSREFLALAKDMLGA